MTVSNNSSLPTKGQMVRLLENAGKGTAAELNKLSEAEVKKKYNATFKSDDVMTSDQVKALGAKAGWDQGKIDAALAKVDTKDKGKINKAEFDALVQEVGASQGKSLLQALIADPETFEKWNPSLSELTALETEAKTALADKLNEAKDTSKPAADRLKAAQEAEHLARLVNSAVAGSGHTMINMNAQRDEAITLVSDMKLATGDDAELEKRLGAAGADATKIGAIAAALPAGDVRREVLEALVADGKVDSTFDKSILAALTEKRNGKLGVAEMEKSLKAALAAVSGGDAAQIELAAKAYSAAASGENQKLVGDFKDRATALSQIAKATTPKVREELLKGMDGVDNDKKQSDDQVAFANAAKAASTKEDLAALKAFGNMQTQEKDPYFDATFMNKLDLIEKNFDGLKAEPDVWSNMMKLLADKVDNKKDFGAALMAAKTPAAVDALLAYSADRGTHFKGVDVWDKMLVAFAGKDKAAFIGLTSDAKKAWLQPSFTDKEQTELGIK